jgi:hypothetical protein
VDNTIEQTLNELSLFQKPIKLYSHSTYITTSQSKPNPSSKPNQLDPLQTKKPILSDQSKPTFPLDSSPTASNHISTSISTNHTCHTPKKQTRKTPYNTRLTKRPLITTQDSPKPANSNDSTPHCNEKKKRPCPSDFLSPPKKSHGAVADLAEPPDTTPSNLILFSPGTMEKKSARLLLKAARKGKTKIVSAVFEPEATSEENGGFAKPPQYQ